MSTGVVTSDAEQVDKVVDGAREGGIGLASPGSGRIVDMPRRANDH
ncbi:hypothetical protein [Streptomyces sp. NPDC058632]